MSKIKTFFGKFFSNNGVMKILAFAAAFVFWFIVVGVESPEIQKEYRGVPISVSLAGTAAEKNELVLTDSLSLSVNATFQGARAEIASFSKDDIYAKLDFSSVTVAGTYTLPVVIEYDHNSLTLVKSSLSEVTVKLDNKVSKSVDITVITSGSVSDGFILDSVKAYPTSLLITGPESVVNSVVNASVSLNLDGISATASKNLPYTLFDADGKTVPTGVMTFDAAQIMVTASVYKTKEVTLTYSVFNSTGGNDSLFADIIISPAKVLISGSEDVISRISTIDLGSFDAASMPDEGYTAELPITLPNGVRIVDEITTADVSVKYNDMTTRDFTVPLSVNDIIMPDGKKVTISSKNVKITLRGRAADLENLTLDEITPVIDLSDYTITGNLKVPVTFVLPSNSHTAVKGSYNVSVTIK